MPRVGAVIGSAEHALTQKVFLRYSFLPLASATSLTVLPTPEVTPATIFRLGLTVPSPASSLSVKAVSLRTATTGRAGILFVASRNNF